MRPLHLDGIVFSQAEMLVLMHAVRPVNLVGIDSDTLVPATPEAHQALIREGIRQLEARGLLSIEDEVHILNPDLLLIARTVAFPRIVTILLKDIPEVGQQQFVYHQADQFITEHTMPAAQQYRFAALPNLRAQFERMAFILSVHEDRARPSFDVKIPQDVFFHVREKVLSGAQDGARQELHAQGLTPETVQTLLHAMTNQRFSGTVAYMTVEPPRIVDARNLLILQGQDSTWVALPAEAGWLRLHTVTADTMVEVLSAGWQGLVS